jgi:hypothetical protein
LCSFAHGSRAIGTSLRPVGVGRRAAKPALEPRPASNCKFSATRSPKLSRTQNDLGHNAGRARECPSFVA